MPKVPKANEAMSQRKTESKAHKTQKSLRKADGVSLNTSQRKEKRIKKHKKKCCYWFAREYETGDPEKACCCKAERKAPK